MVMAMQLRVKSVLHFILCSNHSLISIRRDTEKGDFRLSVFALSALAECVANRASDTTALCYNNSPELVESGAVGARMLQSASAFIPFHNSDYFQFTWLPRCLICLIFH